MQHFSHIAPRVCTLLLFIVSSLNLLRQCCFTIDSDIEAGHSNGTGKFINIKIIIEIFSVIVTFLLFIFRKQRTILRFEERAGLQWYRR